MCGRYFQQRGPASVAAYFEANPPQPGPPPTRAQIDAAVARAQALALREGPMLEAARAVGVPARRVLRVYVLPQLAGPLLVLAGMSVPAASA